MGLFERKLKQLIKSISLSKFVNQDIIITNFELLHSETFKILLKTMVSIERPIFAVHEANFHKICAKRSVDTLLSN